MLAVQRRTARLRRPTRSEGFDYSEDMSDNETSKESPNRNPKRLCLEALNQSEGKNYGEYTSSYVDR